MQTILHSIFRSGDVAQWEGTCLPRRRPRLSTATNTQSLPFANHISGCANVLKSASFSEDGPTGETHFLPTAGF